jgi:preprotein translocase subunit SecD
VSIVDSNLTTLLTALVLFQFGTGPVKGFAVTLGIGIVASMFTAIFITRTLFMLYLDRRPANQPISI